MNQRFITTGSILALLGTLLPATAGERRPSKAATPTPAPTTVSTDYHTAGFRPVRKVAGNLTLDEAINIALRQNPAILTALQQIEVTRGQIIEVRAAALPQITLSGSYDQTDPNLVKGGGSGGGGVQGNGSAVTGVPASPTSSGGGATVSSVAASAAAQPTTPLGTIGSGTAPASGATTTVTGVTQAEGTGPTLRTRAVVTTPDGQTTTTSGGGTAATTTQTAAAQAVDVKKIISQLQSEQQRSDTILQDKSWNITLEVRQTLYQGGQIAAAIKIAQFTQDSAYYQLRDTVDTIVSTVRRQFYSVLLDRALITVQEESVRLLGEQLQDQKNRFEAGTVPRFNVLQAEVALANQQPQLISARTNYLVAQVQLAKTLSADPGPNGKPEFYCVGELGVPSQRLRLTEALQVARARRPFLKVQRQTILIDAEDIKVQLAGYKPTLDANAGYQLRNNALSDDIGNTVNGWFFGVTGSWAIFDGFATYGRVKQARARLEQARANYEDSVHEVDLEVQTSFGNLQEARETIASGEETVKQALEAVRLAQERFNAGAGTQLDVLNAQVQLTTARSTELQAKANYNIAMAQFDLATATDTVYAEKFRDPLDKTQRSIFGKAAEIGLPPLPPADERRHRDAKSH